jgi:cytochrome P450
MCAYVLTNMSRNWERPDEFLPERWLNEERKLLTTEAAYFGCGEKQETISFLPFLAGPR